MNIFTGLVTIKVYISDEKNEKNFFRVLAVAKDFYSYQDTQILTDP